VKESIFNILSDSIEGARVLDLFCGTGNLSLESYSQGAQSVLSVDNHPDSVSMVIENMAHMGVKSGIKVIKQDVKRFLSAYQDKPFDLIFIDPPFTEKMADDVMGWVSKSRTWTESTTIIIESSSKETIQDQYDKLTCVDRRSYGDKLVSFFAARATLRDLPNKSDTIEVSVGEPEVDSLNDSDGDH
jgi:16S rRNA (guanine966-N2)-methyltransferase